MNPREKAQQIIYTIIKPVVKLLIKLKITPNIITSIGLIINIFATIVFIIGGEKGNRADLSYIGWGCGLILFAGLFDMLDGQVARIGNMVTKFGAFYDSVLDRYSELLMYFGICYYLVAHHYFLSSVFAFIALIGSMMVSYTRARAEGIGIECKTGLMQRPERIVIISVSGLLCALVSHLVGGNIKFYVTFFPFHIAETITIFTFPIAIVAILSNFTAIKRLLYCKKQLT